MSNRLVGKVAVLTGASRGIGAAVARRFGAEGASVVVGYYPDDEMASLATNVAREITAAGGTAIAFPSDVTDPTQVDAMANAAIDRFGSIDVLVANAAAFQRGPWDSATDADWDRVLDVNVKGTFSSIRSVLPAMIEQGSGSIITLSSVMARAGVTGMLPYVASKGAIVAMTRSLARELGPSGVRVNAVAPGAIKTEHEKETPGPKGLGDYMAETFQSIPRRGVAADLEGAFVYLASSESDFVTGQVIAVDGGWVNR